MKLVQALLNGNYYVGVLEKGQERKAFDVLLDEFSHHRPLLNKAQFIQTSLYDDLKGEHYYGSVSRYAFHNFTLDQMGDDGLVITKNRIIGFYALDRDDSHPECHGLDVTFKPVKVGIKKPRILPDYTNANIFEVEYKNGVHRFVEEYEKLATIEDLLEHQVGVRRILSKEEYLEISVSYDLLYDDEKMRYRDFDLKDINDQGYVIKGNRITIFWKAFYHEKETPDARAFSVGFFPPLSVFNREARFKRE